MLCFQWMLKELGIFLFSRYPGVLSEVQEEKGIKYKFEVYEKKD